MCKSLSFIKVHFPLNWNGFRNIKIKSLKPCQCLVLSLENRIWESYVQDYTDSLRDIYSLSHLYCLTIYVVK